jgi:hypothetical protein
MVVSFYCFLEHPREAPMSDVAKPEISRQPTEVRHLELVECEASRLRRVSPWVRAATWSSVSVYIALHGSSGQARYMFVAPMLAAAGWLLDAHVEYRAKALGELARAIRGERGPTPSMFTLDASSWTDSVSIRRILLQGTRVLAFHPLAVIAAYISVDAPRLDPEGFPSELFWYLLVTFGAIFVLILSAWSWWYDHFSDAQTPKFTPTMVPSLQDGNASSPGPFPPSRDDQRTRPFGTAV